MQTRSLLRELCEQTGHARLLCPVCRANISMVMRISMYGLNTDARGAIGLRADCRREIVGYSATVSSFHV